MEGVQLNRYQKMNKLERVDNARKTIAARTAGYGMYVFKNHTKGELMLPKPTANGKRRVAKDEEFEGDNYFLAMVKSHDLILVREILSPAQQRADKLELVEKEKVLMEQKKLLLDQPDTVTSLGKVEHVVVDAAKIQKPLTESKGGKAPDVLLNESPDLDGVEIVQ